MGGWAWELLLEDTPEKVVLLGARRFVWEAFGTSSPHLIGNHLFGVLLQAIYPAVAYTIGELLLLAPQNLGREIRPLLIIKCLAQDPLFLSRVYAVGLVVEIAFLLGRVDVHAHL